MKKAGDIMPGYILHLTEAKLICEGLRKKLFVSSDWETRFSLGNLMPDTKRKKEKITSHFWNPATLNNLAIAPDLQKFESLYGNNLTSPEMLGYWTHLHLDTLYVETFWPTIIETRNTDHEKAVLMRDIDSIYLKHADKEISAEDFFSSNYYYGDYSRMNLFLTNKYHLEIPDYVNLKNFPVREVNPDDIKSILLNMQILLESSPDPKLMDLRVFNITELESFIKKSAQTASAHILQLMQA